VSKDPLDRVDCEEEEEESCPSPSPPTPSLTARTVPQTSILETSNSSTSDPQQEASPVPSVNTSSESVSNSVLPVPGPKVGIEPDGHPYDFFCQIWGPDTFKDIAAQTNLYASQKGTTTLKEFVLQLSEYLIGCNNSRKRSSAQEPPPASRLCGRHFPDRMSTQHQCKVCTQRRRTVFCCKDCSPERPVPLCPTSCFKVYHTKLNIGRR
jgi:hypothetical protein